MSITSELIIFSKRNQVVYLTLNRAPANAYNMDFMSAFYNAVERANQDKQINVVVICSHSEKFFCAGADIKEFQQNETASNKRMVEKARATMAAIEVSDKIYIAQIAGHALGGGLEIAMSCDLRFAAKGDYLLGLPEIKLGLIPGNGGTQRLTRLVGVSKTLEILTTGDSFSVEQAFNIGLINQCFEADNLIKETYNYAMKIAKGPALAIAATKKAVMQGSELSLVQALAVEQRLSDELYDTEDSTEGFNAFIEKRQAVFKGK
jgi:enoyl-CoA hydratase/carnithine racemase